MTRDDEAGVLRALRAARGLTLEALASRAHISRSQLNNIELRRKRLTAAMAHALDSALGTTVLGALVELEGDDVRRRTLIATALAGAVAGAVPDALRLRLERAGAHVDALDWGGVCARYTSALATGAWPGYGAALAADLASVEAAVAAPRPSRDVVRAAAVLTECYGLYSGESGDPVGARRWYTTAAALADRSGHPATAAYVRGRTASRLPYEGGTAAETLALAARVIAAPRATEGTVEAYSALVHIHALTGDLTAARRAVAGMRRAADALVDGDRPAGAAQRAVLFHNYLECRIGPRAAAQAAHDEAEAALANLPSWLADSRLYWARALVRDGDVDDGLAAALHAVTSLGPVRTLSIAAADVLAAVPAGYRSADLDELRRYAPAGPMPWEALR